MALKISPFLIFIIIILALIFFIVGLLHLIIRFLVKKRSSHSFATSNRYNQERQLQNLFNLHDSGLDQSLIDSLPVFYYNEIMGLNDPFDCAICISEFTPSDKLRLLPLCTHAFHMDCIDTWLLSSSSCPLCRSTLFHPGQEFQNPSFCFDDTVEENRNIYQENAIDKRVFSIRLGKFKNGEKEQGETSSSNMEARRCFSMGYFQYFLDNSDLQVALDPNNRCKEGQSGNLGGVEGNKINFGAKRDSFSVSKIWQWSKKDKFQNSNDSCLNSNLPWIEKVLPA